MLLGNEPSPIGIFPDWKTRARRTPSLNDLSIRSRAWTNPFKQVKYQCIDGIKHMKPRSCSRDDLYIGSARVSITHRQIDTYSLEVVDYRRTQIYSRALNLIAQ